MNQTGGASNNSDILFLLEKENVTQNSQTKRDTLKLKTEDQILNLEQIKESGDKDAQNNQPN